MKKVIYSILFVSALFLSSCSDDDDGGNCLSCGDDGQVCDNGDGTFTSTGSDEDGDFTFTATYESIGVADFDELTAGGCDQEEEEEEEEEEEAGECVTCAEYTFQGNTIPATDVCELENGNAVVSGIDLGISFSQYIATQEPFTSCD